MFATAVRFLASKSKPKRKKESGYLINPHLMGEDAFKLSAQLQAIIKQHGPLSVNSCWEFAKEIEVLRNKRSMKVMLHWMTSRHHCRMICKHQNDHKHAPVKEFLYAEWVPRPGQKGGPPLEQPPPSAEPAETISSQTEPSVASVEQPVLPI